MSLEQIQKWEQERIEKYNEYKIDGCKLILGGDPEYRLGGTKVVDMSGIGMGSSDLLISQNGISWGQQSVTLTRSQFIEMIYNFTSPELLKELISKMETK